MATFFNSYFFYIILLVIITFIIISFLIGSLILLFIFFQYKNRIFNYVKRLTEQFCKVLNTQIYSYSYEAQNTLRLLGDQNVVSLTIHRKPIPSFVNTALNIISVGKWNEERNKNNQLNTIYHLTLECGLANGIKVFCQKNERIDINTTYMPTIQTEFCSVPLHTGKPTFTLNEMLKKTNELMGDSRYFLFNQQDNNCQVYIKNILIAMGLYSDETDQFVFQQVENVFATFTPLANKCIDVLKWLCIAKSNIVDKLSL
jgi:hypothetical protein